MEASSQSEEDSVRSPVRPRRPSLRTAVAVSLGILTAGSWALLADQARRPQDAAACEETVAYSGTPEGFTQLICP